MPEFMHNWRVEIRSMVDGRPMVVQCATCGTATNLGPGGQFPAEEGCKGPKGSTFHTRDSR